MNTTLRFAVAALAVLLVCGVFCGAAAADDTNPQEWSTFNFWSHDDSDTHYYYITSLDNTLAPKGDITVKGKVTLDFQNKQYVVGNKYEGGESDSKKRRALGGLIGNVEFSDSGSQLIIENLHISGGSVSGYSGVGGLIGAINSEKQGWTPTEMYGSLTLKNCYISGVEISGSSTSTMYNNAGGLVGYVVAASCTYENCTVEDCTISLNEYNAGGLVGNMHYYSSCTASGCTVANCKIEVLTLRNAGGLVGVVQANSKSIELMDCTVANCVISAKQGGCGGIIGNSACGADNIRIYRGNTVRNCLIYTPNEGNVERAVGGIVGHCATETGGKYTCTGNTVEFCTVANQATSVASGNPDYAIDAGGIAGSFPSSGEMTKNNVYNTCVVSLHGTAAGICPKLT